MIGIVRFLQEKLLELENARVSIDRDASQLEIQVWHEPNMRCILFEYVKVLHVLQRNQLRDDRVYVEQLFKTLESEREEVVAPWHFARCMRS